MVLAISWPTQVWRISKHVADSDGKSVASDLKAIRFDLNPLKSKRVTDPQVQAMFTNRAGLYSRRHFVVCLLNIPPAGAEKA